ncbi:MAG: ATP-grasp domain-containing protein [Streptosporangiaceae bacterium]|nr:ATP-grasp domain-containing protein [Streptosporangiaceae bacterium]
MPAGTVTAAMPADHSVSTDYLRALKKALTGSDGKQLVLLCNFEAELQRMEELGCLLAARDDVLILKYPLDPDYAAYLTKVGLPPPTVAVPENVVPGRTTTEDVLDSPILLDRLSRLARDGALLLPVTTTAAEEELAGKCGLPLAVPGAATFERVNSKIYGRRLCSDAGIRPVPGHCCESVTELAGILRGYKPVLEAGGRVVVKDAFGVSGKRLVVLDHPARADQLLRMIQRRAADARLNLVVEEWIGRRYDLNYQVTVSRDGGMNLDFIKVALNEKGIHRGHVMPAPLTRVQRGEIESAAIEVGKRLHADGFFGVVGIDAIVGADNTIYPVLEINARLNMSTYQGSVLELHQPAGYMALARHYSLHTGEPLTFSRLSRALGHLLEPGGSQYLIITCFGTVNANAEFGLGGDGRLYTILFAASQPRLAALDGAVQATLSRLCDG